MTISFCDYQIKINSVANKYLQKISSEEVNVLKKQLDSLASILGDKFPWVLTGGLAIPITIGSFYRKHDDVDIGVSSDDLENLVEKARVSGYDLFSRPIMVKIPGKRKIDVYKRVSPEEAISSTNTRIRLVKTNSNGEVVNKKNLLDYFDVYIHNYKNGFLFSKDGKVVVPIEDSVGPAYSTISGRIIFPRGLKYIEMLKSQNSECKNELDLRIIRNFRRAIS